MSAAPETPFFKRLEDRIRSWSSASVVWNGARTTVEKHRKLVPTAFFLGGVVWDGATLRRIDAWVDNALLFVYLLLLGTFIVIGVLVDRNRIFSPRLLRYNKWYQNLIQFFLGALFSAYFIFYLQSTSFQSESMVFLSALILLLIANEFLHKRLLNPFLLLSLYFIACASFFTFFLPVLTKQMGYLIFLAGCVISLVIITFIIGFFHHKDAFKKDWYYPAAFAMPMLLFGLLNLAYVKNWIPPVPVSLRDGDVYHRVEREGDDFLLTYQKAPYLRFWDDSDNNFQYTPGDTVFCFTAIFAPTELKTGIYHAWNRYDEDAAEWVRTDSIAHTITGGRGNGYRTYTFKRNMIPGRWRVDVQTEDERTLGRILFTVTQADSIAGEWVTRRYR